MAYTLNKGSKREVEKEARFSLEVDCVEELIVVVVPLSQLCSTSDKEDVVLGLRLWLIGFQDEVDCLSQVLFGELLVEFRGKSLDMGVNREEDDCVLFLWSLAVFFEEIHHAIEHTFFVLLH